MRAKQVEMTAQVRTEVGKSAVKKLRAAGKVPGVVYGRGVEPVPVSVDRAGFARALSGGGSTLINLHIEGLGGGGGKRGEGSPTVMIAEVQHDPVRGRLVCVDFHRISLKETVRARVPVVYVGESPGVKQGGVVEHFLHEVEVECLPTALPDHLEADISQLQITDTFRVRDLKVDPDVKVLSRGEDVILVVAPPAKVEVVEPAPAEAGAVVAEAEEPEVISSADRRKRTGEEEG